MIRTKSQIIRLMYAEYPAEVIEMMVKRMLRIPEFDFIRCVKNGMNWNLEIVRRNLYIVTT